MIVLTKRERLLGLSLAAAISVSCLYAVMIRPTCHRIQTLERIIPDKQSELHVLEAKSVEYPRPCARTSKHLPGQGSRTGPELQLLPYLETLLDKQV